MTDTLDALLMRALCCDWRGALDIAQELGLAWQPVALALKRMAREGTIEGREIHRRGTRYRWRISHQYRRHPIRAEAPEWLERRTVPVGNGSVTVILGLGLVGRGVRRR